MPGDGPRYVRCDGCGNDDPRKRCLGCFHDFGGDDAFSLSLREAAAERAATRLSAERAVMEHLTAAQRRSLGLPDFAE
jgi:hypothetical protein